MPNDIAPAGFTHFLHVHSHFSLLNANAVREALGRPGDVLTP